MENRPFSHVTFHRVRFSAPVDARHRTFDGPDGAVHWVFGPDSVLGEDGLRTHQSDVWGGAAFYADGNAADAAMTNPASTLPFVAEALEAWHGRLCPISHRGEVNWFGALDEAARFVPAAEDPGGTLVVMTSAGYNPLPREELKADLPRRLGFLANVDRVRAWYGSLPSNRASAVFQPGPAIGRTDGLTFTAWQDDVAMGAAAYRAGVHREQLDHHRTTAVFDRSSFTRARILRSAGTWDGTVLA